MSETASLCRSIARWKHVAPGHVRLGVETLLRTAPLGRAEKTDWRRVRDALESLALTPQGGRMYFPVVLEGPIAGTIATVGVAPWVEGDRDFSESVFAARVRPWLVRTITDWTGAEATAVEERLKTVAIRWWEGRAAPSHTLSGESADLATAVAVVSHLTGRAPDAAWILSGALGAPGVLKAVDQRDVKREIARIEAPGVPAERIVYIDAQRAQALMALDLFEQVLGGGLKASLAAAVGESATSCLDKARTLWENRSEAAAARMAERALDLNPTSHQRAFARMVIAAQAIHEGRLDAADELLQVPYGLEVDSRSGWSRYDLEAFRVRVAMRELDALHFEVARTLMVGVLEWLGGRERESRPDDWHRVAAEAAGTLATVRAVSGDLVGAIAARRRALDEGPPQEEARSRMQLAELLSRTGDADGAREELGAARAALRQVPAGEGRLRTERFLRIAEIRHGVCQVSGDDVAKARVTPPDLRHWPEPAETVAVLLASGEEDAALEWFEAYVFGRELEEHVTWRFFLVTSAARAVSRGMTSPRWREGAAGIVVRLRQRGVDEGLLEACEAFVAGGPPEPLLARSVY